jgi:NADH-quinone oxidoreductase subunit G
METVKLTIDGQEVTAPKGELLIEICEMNGIYLPRFCHFRGLTPQASCRMCVVRVEKMPKLQTACTIPVTDGMIVTTNSDEIEDVRGAMIEFLLANHPVDCPVCDRAGECELQDQTFGFGEDRIRSQFDDKEPTLERQISPFMYNDPQRCVTCKRCTRVCEEWMDEFAITTVNRGSHTLISSFGGWVECSDCGNCVDVCPTGTLLHVPYKYVARPWDLKQTPTICNFCSDGCSILAGTRSETLIRAVARDGRGRTAGGINHDFLCALGRYTVDLVHSPERIDRPMIRRGEHLVPTTWDDAVAYGADRLDKVIKGHGGDSIGVITSPRLLNEDHFVIKRLANEVFGTARVGVYHADDEIDFASFFKHGSPVIASQEHIQNADVILLVGSDPNEENPLTAFSIRWAVRQSSARLFIVNAVASRLERQAEIALRVREGSEGAAILALIDSASIANAADAMGIEASELEKIRAAIEENARVVVIFGDELRGAALEALTLLESTLPENAEKASEAKKAHIDVLSRQVRSTNSTNKPSINENPFTSIVPRPTLEVGAEPARTSTKFSFVPLARYSNSLGAVHMGLNAAADRASDVRALYIAGEDPVGKRGENGAPGATEIERLDLLIVQDMFLTETAKLADVVFPSTSFAESQGTQVNNGSQVQLVRRVIPPVGQARQDWAIASLLAKAMGRDFGYQNQVRQVFKNISETAPGYAGLSHNRLAAEGALQVQAAGAGDADRSDILRRLSDDIAAVDRNRPVNREPLTDKAGARLHQRYVQLTRYSDMFSPTRNETQAEEREPLVFPA